MMLKPNGSDYLPTETPKREHAWPSREHDSNPFVSIINKKGVMIKLGSLIT